MRLELDAGRVILIDKTKPAFNTKSKTENAMLSAFREVNSMMSVGSPAANPMEATQFGWWFQGKGARVREPRPATLCIDKLIHVTNF